MENDILRGIVEVEKDIRQRLEIERKRVTEWLEEVKKELENKVLAEESGLKDTLSRTAEDSRSDAQVEASGIIDEAQKYATKLENLSDELLKKIALRHLSCILPGE